MRALHTTRPTDLMRVLLTGANGMLAHAICAAAPAGVDLVARTHEELDVADGAQVAREVDAAKPQLILNTAAYTDVDGAEVDTQVVERVNARAPGLLGRAAARIGAKVVHFSTDHVFDGESNAPYAEDAPTNPINGYGRSKLEGERALLESGARHLIIRTQWLFGPAGRNFSSTMWARARERIATRVVDDQTGVPTSTEDLAAATWSLLDHDGILHIVNEGVASWYDVAERVFSTVGALHCLEHCSTNEFPTVARRPLHSVLSTSRLQRLGVALPPWQASLDQYIARITATNAS